MLRAKQVENFVQQLADWAKKDRNALLCQLNSYERPKQEVVARNVKSMAYPEIARNSRPEIPDGVYLAWVNGAQFRWHATKPFYVLRLAVVEPVAWPGTHS
jgi:hypothetical protein